MKQPEYVVIIPGRAYSGSGHSATRYKAQIRGIAAQHIPEPLLKDNLYLRVDYFHLGKNRVDVNNLAKSICDGLKGIAYRDDSQISHQEVHRYNIDSSYRIEKPVSPDIFDSLAKHKEFVAIAVKDV